MAHTLCAVDSVGANLLEIDPLTAAVLSTTPITVAGETVTISVWAGSCQALSNSSFAFEKEVCYGITFFRSQFHQFSRLGRYSERPM